jgi:hypothetical protein
MVLIATLLTLRSLSAQFGQGVLITYQLQLLESMHQVIQADLDADGDIDIVIRVPGAVVWLENSDGEGGFAPPDTLYQNDVIELFDVADMDGDLDQDLVMVAGSDEDIIWCVNQGGGAMSLPQLITSTTQWELGVGQLRCHDISGDGSPEVIFSTSSYLRWFLNSNATFTDMDSLSIGGPPVREFVVGDLDLDGDADLAAVNWNNMLMVGLNPGVTVGPWNSELTLGGFFDPWGDWSSWPELYLLDVDGDTDLDIVYTAMHLQVTINRRIEDGYWSGFAPSTNVAQPATYGVGWAGSLGCGMGTSVLRHIWGWAGPIQWFHFDSELGSYSAPIALMDTIRSSYLGAADLNGDGRNDLIIADRDTTMLWWFPNELPVGPSSSEVEFTPFDTLCASGLSYTLDHALPSGGSWSGPGVFDNVFTPPGEGTFQLVYTVADGGTGCPLSASQSILVVQSPTLTVLSGDPLNGCDTDPVIYGASPSGGTWFGVANASGVVDRSCEARPSFGPVVYTMDAVNGGDCTVGGPTFFELLECTPVDLGPDQQLCMKEDTLMVTLQGPFIGAASLGGFDRVQFEPPATVFGFFYPTVGPGVYEFTGTASGSGTCPGFDTLLVTVVPGPTPQILTDLEVCVNDTFLVVEADTVGVFGGQLNGTDSISAPVNPSLLGVGSYPFSFTVTDANGCETVLAQSFVVLPQPSASITSALSFCAYDTLISVVADTVGVFSGGLTGIGTNSDLVNPSVLGSGSHPFTFTVTGANGCVVAFADTLIVVPAPLVTLVLVDTAFLLADLPFPLTDQGSPAGGVYTLDDSSLPITSIDGMGLSLGPHRLYYTYDTLGCSGLDSVDFTVDSSTGLDNTTSTGFSLVPNPAKDQCQVWFPGGDHANVQLHDALGRKVGNWQAVAAPFLLELSSTTPGTYVVAVEHQGEIHRSRLVVQ